MVIWGYTDPVTGRVVSQQNIGLPGVGSIPTAPASPQASNGPYTYVEPTAPPGPVAGAPVTAPASPAAPATPASPVDGSHRGGNGNDNGNDPNSRQDRNDRDGAQGLNAGSTEGGLDLGGLEKALRENTSVGALADMMERGVTMDNVGTLGGGLLGGLAFGPLGGVLGAKYGPDILDGLADALDMRDGEVLRDALEDPGGVFGYTRDGREVSGRDAVNNSKRSNEIAGRETGHGLGQMAGGTQYDREKDRNDRGGNHGGGGERGPDSEGGRRNGGGRSY